jgi:hypothetical protein
MHSRILNIKDIDEDKFYKLLKLSKSEINMINGNSIVEIDEDNEPIKKTKSIKLKKLLYKNNFNL